jgi:hypothetical protein
MDIESVISKHRVSKSSLPKFIEVNVFDEILKRLEQTKSIEMTYEKIDYDMNFKGLYKNIRFHFIVYIEEDRQLKREEKKKNCVWNQSYESPVVLKSAVDEVIQYAKRVEVNGGRKVVIESFSIVTRMTEL